MCCEMCTLTDARRGARRSTLVVRGRCVNNCVREMAAERANTGGGGGAVFDARCLPINPHNAVDASGDRWTDGCAL